MASSPGSSPHAAAIFAALDRHNITTRHGDGYKGWPEQAPFECIMVTAAAPEIPQALIDQLAPGGRLVIPVGMDPVSQRLLKLVKHEDGTITTTHAWFTAFAPYQDPEIAVVVFIYGGGEGSITAMPVTAAILNYYFQLY